MRGAAVDRREYYYVRGYAREENGGNEENGDENN
jgi:hypothetical protein